MPNCKPGDLAIVVKSKNGKNLGKIVRVIERVTVPVVEMGGIKFTTSNLTGEVLWLIDQPLQHLVIDLNRFFQGPYCPDSVLRPLRDNPGADETLAWAPVPKKEKA